MRSNGADASQMLEYKCVENRKCMCLNTVYSRKYFWRITSIVANSGMKKC